MELKWKYKNYFQIANSQIQNVCKIITKTRVYVENNTRLQQAHNIKMTSYKRRCDVITSHRR